LCEPSTAPYGGDESWFAGQVAMIAYRGERPLIDHDLLHRFTLYVSVLNAEQTSRS